MYESSEFMRSGVAAHHCALPFAGHESDILTTTETREAGSRLRGQHSKVDSAHRNGGVAKKASTSVRLKQEPHAGPAPASDPNA